MVNVKLMENRVNNHVGKVIVVKVMIQYKAPGMKVTRVPRVEANPGEDGTRSTCCPGALVEAERPDTSRLED